MRKPNNRELYAWAFGVASAVGSKNRCIRLSVGCVLLDKHGRILATGHNGPPRKIPNCSVESCPGANVLEVGRGLGTCRAAHAEINALIQCANISKVRTVVVTAFPCFDCLKALLNSGMKTLVYGGDYPRAPDGLRLLDIRGIVGVRFEDLQKEVNQ
jgi:dCMP deaminase